MVVCAAIGCFSRSSKKSRLQINFEKENNIKITFHRYPKNPELVKKWNAVAHREGWIPYTGASLCSQHFSNDSFDQTYLNILKLQRSAIPTIYKTYSFPKTYQDESTLSGIPSLLPPDTGIQPSTSSSVSLPPLEEKKEEAKLLTFHKPYYLKMDDMAANKNAIAVETQSVQNNSMEEIWIKEESIEHSEEHLQYYRDVKKEVDPDNYQDNSQSTVSITQFLNNSVMEDISIKEEPIEHSGEYLQYYRDVKNEVDQDNYQESYDLSNHLIATSHESLKDANEQFEPEFGFSNEVIDGAKEFSKKILLFISNLSGPKYNCNICGKSFARKNYLTRHSLVHSRVRSHDCNICKKSFAHKPNLTIHLRIHAGVKPFGCDVCKKSFSRKCSLIDHLRTHSGAKPYNCSFCTKHFATRGQLADHWSSIHSSKRPYGCEICKKSFALKSYLTRHLAIHSDVKPFSCDICKTRFSFQTNLVSHYRRHQTYQL